MQPVFEEIKAVRKRRSQYPEILIQMPCPTLAPLQEDTVEHKRWYKRHEWLANFTTSITERDTAILLRAQLEQAILANNKRRQKEIIGQLRTICYPRADKRTALQTWRHMLLQMPEDIGGGQRVKRRITRILSQRCFGLGLEAMCGFNSYLRPSSNREVIAQDYCREALELYPHPKRKRILFDWNASTTAESLGFVMPQSLDFITICFGWRYPRDVRGLSALFKALLRPGGKLCFVESPTCGYENLTVRQFSPRCCAKTLEACGFAEIRVDKLEITWKWDRNNYYLIEAIKGQE